MNSDSQLSTNSGHSLLVVSFLSPIGMADVFSRLPFSQEILAKCFRIDTHSLKYYGFLFIKMLVSSAKVSDQDSFFA